MLLPTHATPGSLALSLFPGTVQTPALQVIDNALAQVASTPGARLIITMAPQEGKSSRVARDFPIWWLTRRPLSRIITASYGDDLAIRNGRAVRNAISRSPQTGLRIQAGNSSVKDWRLSNGIGGMRSVGIGAGISGHPADCVSGDTYIECEYGRLTAADAFARGITRILAYDHTAERAVWRNVEAARRIDRREVVEVTTQAGRVLVCTPDHRVHTGRGYVPAGSLRRGDTLVAIVDADRVQLRNSLAATAGRDSQGDQARPAPLLLPRVHGGGLREGQSDELVYVRSADPSQPQVDVLRDLRAEAARRGATENVPGVRNAVQAAIQPDAVLREDVREHRALPPHGREGQLALQDRDQLREVVPLHAAANPGARRGPVRSLRAGAHCDLPAQGAVRHEVRAGDPSHQRGRDEQPSREPDHALPRVSHEAPQVTADAVSVVRASCRGEVAVYDFQVEGTRNFFANGLLVHNCLIIDDPIKSQAEADSETYRQNTWDWWQTEAAARLAPGAPVVMILTRWHQDDLAGRMLADPKSRFILVNIPAIADHDPAKGETDPLGRQPGEYMISARGRTREDWEQRRAEAGSRGWAALYQGRPSPEGGGTFKTDWFKRRYTTPQWVETDGVCWAQGFDQLLISADLTFKGTESSDFVAIGVWGRRGGDAYLLDQIHGRMDFVTAVHRFEALCKRWPQATLKLVEDKANGPAMISLLGRRIPGIVPYNPQGGKTARANAWAPYAEAGNIWLPTTDLAPWIDDYIQELSAFPNAAHDDQVDQSSMALDRMLIRPLDAPPVEDDYDDTDYRIGY